MMIDTIRKIFMSSDEVKQSPRYIKIVNMMVNMIGKTSGKYFVHGHSKSRGITIKMTTMMSVQEVKINLESLVNISSTPPENIKYLRLFSDVLEREILEACQNAQSKLYDKANIASNKISDAKG